MKRSSCGDDRSEHVTTYNADGERISKVGGEGFVLGLGDVSTQNDGSEFLLERKRRRGVIEKKRRDRINNSLTELRRLVPGAQEKVATKVEKAEVLQLTVDYLRQMLSRPVDVHVEELDGKASADFHRIGFRECITEVRMYLTQVEGLDTLNPLHKGLMDHLSVHANHISLQHQSSQPMRPPALSSAVQPQWPSSPTYSQATTLTPNREIHSGFEAPIATSVNSRSFLYCQQDLLVLPPAYPPTPPPAYNTNPASFQASQMPASVRSARTDWQDQSPQVQLPSRALLYADT